MKHTYKLLHISGAAVRTRRVHARNGHIDGSTGAKVVKTILQDHNDAGRTGYSEVGE